MPELRQFAQARPGAGPLTATVPREFVHRVAVAEILLTGWARTDTDRFAITAQWPRVHQLHVSPDRSAYEPLLVAETVRQCGALLAHAEYEVPLGHQFVLKELRVDTRPEHLAVGTAPAEPVIDITAAEVRRRAGRPAALRYDAAVRLGGERVATGRISVTWTNESVYRRLRGGRTADVGALRLPRPLPPPLPADTVGRALAADVLLSPAARPGRWRLRVDTAHPVFFDHPLDHVPGMLLLEAALQTVRAHGGRERRVPTSFHATFHQYAELDQPVWTEVSGEDGTDVQVIARQGESVVFECLVGAVAG
ncbi:MULTISPECIES: ScbA/BarX family gamma-butyrolactone biosynthesis protein [Streptomyces]|uniref:A-factor biosynthesis enzyme n=1 Tax=Streptomyces sviceus (strain ATCC 29083 / DSM 924 / JCM 4929 / NBRC 13980 / NCIMB 11184 / NRRL 5439 / UC 5370) TaxID=463191 RepID=B5I944_STRX2|nr:MULTISPECIES: ScbA/BarX family gamma-butyrolactone biosynthesis protein [Streptomyces]EDY61599.2 A-factor biosynthesis enzyme [Streptomyces sviceus ATCC 29083]MYT09163.1 A-factor biosynthesis protein [Streptomyces sp. SID5470]